MKNIILLGIDPGFAHLGYGALCIAPSGEHYRCDAIGTIDTEKSSKKLSVLSAEDNVRRARELTEGLDALIRRFGDERNKLVAICAEAMSWPRNAGATAKVGISWGVIIALSTMHRVPILQTSPQDVKKATAGAKTATKDEVQEAMIRLVPDASKCGGKLAEVALGLSKEERKHAFDGLASAWVCRKSEAVNMARRAAA